MIPYTLYIVDDEQSIRDGVSFGLKKEYAIKAFTTAEEALPSIKNDPPDLVLLDIGLPGMNGIEALKKIRAINPEIRVIMVTAFEDINTVISAMKLGAYDYIIKPLYMDALRVTVKNALDTITLRKELQLLQERHLKENLPGFIRQSDAIQDVMQFVEKVAKSPDTPVLILGETGTGKELIASAIHYKSPNFQGPFVSLNCAAIPRELLESELFGYEKGAFSGADAAGKKGLVEQAANGTLFLDEVGDLSPAAQGKLLRFLEDGEYYRVGGTKKLQLRTRVVSATNRDLDGMVEKKEFRQDLYYRLAVITIEVPSLSKRREDIVPVAKHFLLEFSRKYHKNFTDITPEACTFLENHEWKGNIRELRNLIERGVLIGDGPLLALSDLGIARQAAAEPAPRSDTGAGPSPLPDAGIDLEALEEYYIREAYKKALGNEVKAAQLLHMSYYSYRYRRKRLKII